MTETVIPLYDLRDIRDGQHHRATVPSVPDVLVPAQGWLADTRGRRLHDLRISVTDRCNFRCVYCMPKDVFDKDYRFLRHSELLSFEEIERMARLFIEHGVEKIRLTGGEPLLRKNIERLVEMLARLTTAEGKPLDLTLTTNGALLARKAQSLKDAGLTRVTVSLDGIDDATFRRMNDVDFAVGEVLHGIEVAQRVGLAPIKVNMVVKKGDNDDQIVPMARHFRASGVVLRFIEYMDVGTTNHWDMRYVVPSAEVIQRLSAEFALEPLSANYSGETAERWRYADGAGEIGVISSVTQAFCHDCTRAPVHRGQAVPVPVRDRRLRLACAAAGRGQRPRTLQRHSRHLARPRRPLFRTAREWPSPAGRATHRNVLYRRLSPPASNT